MFKDLLGQHIYSITLRGIMKQMLAYCESSNKPAFLFRERKLISLPSPLSFFTNKCWTVLINHNCNTLCGLIWDSLFTNWKFGFVFDPRLHDLQRLVLKLSTLYFSFSWRTNTIVFAKLNKPPPPSQMCLKEISPLGGGG